MLCESKGLEEIRKNLVKRKHLKTPVVIEVNEHYLKTELIGSDSPASGDWKIFGQELANFHLQKFSKCGLGYDNYIGLNPQKNSWSENWGEFFWEYRLKYQMDLMKDKIELPKDKIIEFLNSTCSHFSLLHGDLWSGNFLFWEGDFYLIDPAIYYGDPDCDLAMTELFGGFSADFYEEYLRIRPLSDSYPIKKLIYNLYHLLNHANIFGDSYRSQCLSYVGEVNKSL